MYISFDISTIILALIIATTCISLIFILWEFLNYRSLNNSLKKSNSINRLSKTDTCEENSGVSVVVYCNNDSSKLMRNLPVLLAQDYPLYEIIVVNDGKSESTQNYVEHLSHTHENLKFTSTPDDARNLSRKKLALMVGIKAAKYDIILTTNANCTPASDKWISSMARHFTTGVDVVIGYSHLTSGTDTKKGHKIRAFLSLRNTIKYLIQALRHKPYRGNSNNLAYRKNLFLKNKGFSHSMHLHYGEDDLFINEISTHNNTQVEISPESIVSVHYDYPSKMFKILKLRHGFTEKLIKSPAFILDSLLSVIYYLIFIGIIAIVAFDYCNIISIASCIAILLLTIIPQIIIYRKTAQLLQSPLLGLQVPLFMLLKPLINKYYKFENNRHTDYNYTWQRLRH